jgi:hypothetical protein
MEALCMYIYAHLPGASLEVQAGGASYLDIQMQQEQLATR